MRERAVRNFLLVAGAFMLIAVIAIATTDRLSLHGSINAHHNACADVFFRYATYLADGWVATTLALLLLFHSWRAFMMLGLGAGISALIAQGLKHFVFGDADRPAEFLVGMPHIKLVPGVELLHHFSFPSGHSTCAFSMCFALAVIIARPLPAALLAVLAALLGFSRVYLSQHFAGDVLGGAFIGTAAAWCVYRWLYMSGFAARAWLSRSPIRKRALSE